MNIELFNYPDDRTCNRIVRVRQTFVKLNRFATRSVASISFLTLVQMLRNWGCEISQLGNTNIYEVFPSLNFEIHPLLKIYENFIYIYMYDVL